MTEGLFGCFFEISHIHLCNSVAVNPIKLEHSSCWNIDLKQSVQVIDPCSLTLKRVAHVQSTDVGNSLPETMTQQFMNVTAEPVMVE
jgi:hypothetical protein